MSLLDAMFAHPRGLAGLLGGTIMARLSGARDTWIIDQIDIQPADHILEVGFGPGAALRELTSRARAGFVAGVDTSPLMLRQATKRNSRAVRAGQVQLRQGSALALPFAEASFDKALTINSIQLWPDRFAGVKEIQRVLKTGGLVALALQPIWAKTDSEVRKIGEDLLELLKQAGFVETRLEFKPMKPMACVCALGVK